jgi:DNA-binding MarR family transcriptional regulator
MNNQAVATKRRQLNATWVLFEVLGAALDIERKADAALAEIGLSLPKLGVLWRLASEDEPLALSELARCNKCVRSNMTQLVDRLEADGLVRRIDDPDDRRIRRAALTTAGREAFAKGERVVAAQERAIKEALGPADSATLMRLVNQLPE